MKKNDKVQHGRQEKAQEKIMRTEKRDRERRKQKKNRKINHRRKTEQKKTWRTSESERKMKVVGKEKKNYQCKIKSTEKRKKLIVINTGKNI